MSLRDYFQYFAAQCGLYLLIFQHEHLLWIGLMLSTIDTKMSKTLGAILYTKQSIQLDVFHIIQQAQWQRYTKAFCVHFTIGKYECIPNK